MSALLFPGQGSQIVGMGNEFFNNFKIVKNIFHQADDKVKLPFIKNDIRRSRKRTSINKKYSTSYNDSKLFNI